MNEWSKVADWLSYSDAEGNAATKYQFYDASSGANSSYFWTLSNAHHPADSYIDVAASDLASVWCWCFIAQAEARLRISGAVIDCDGQHEMSGLGDTCEPVHNAADSGEPVCPHQRLDGPRWLRRTKGLIKQRSSIMSKYTTFKFVPVIGAVLAFAITAAEPAHAARNNACATARAIFKAQMNEARFFLGVADQLAAAGNEASANLAHNEANFFLGQAEAALNAMSEAC